MYLLVWWWQVELERLHDVVRELAVGAERKGARLVVSFVEPITHLHCVVQKFRIWVVSQLLILLFRTQLCRWIGADRTHRHSEQRAEINGVDVFRCSQHQPSLQP